MKIGTTIYLDHQATTPMDPRVLKSMMPFFQESFGNPHSTDHVIGWKTSQAVESATERIAQLIGSDPDEIIFTSGATEANNLALLGFGRAGCGSSTRKRVLLAATEHKCILSAGRALEKQLGLKVQLVPVDKEGFVNTVTLEKMLGYDVLLVSVMAVNNEIGTIQNIEDISTSVRSHGAVFHCDAAQAPVAVDLSSFADFVDMLSLSAHKMYGPQGIGALYVSRELHERMDPIMFGGGQQNGIRSGTVPVSLCVGFGEAADCISEANVKILREKLRKVTNRFIDKLFSLPFQFTLNGSNGDNRHPGNANIRFEGFEAQSILFALQPHVAASTGSACTSGTPESSHVLRAIGLNSEQAESSIRFSLGFTTTEDEVDEAVRLISVALDKLS